MANVPLVASPILPPVPDEPKLDDAEDQKIIDALWKWMKDITVQLKILLGSPQASNTAITVPLVQAGMMIPFAGLLTNMPSGYLACDGTAVSRTQYPALFSAIGELWGAGDGSTTFNVPDLRGRGVLGAGTGPGLSARSLAQTGGEETHVLTALEIPAHGHSVAITDHAHTHPLTDPGHLHLERVANGGVSGNLSVQGVTGDSNGTLAVATPTNSATTAITMGQSTTGITAVANNAGGGGAHNNMAPYAVALWMIKF